mgnify:CR=1 FL=1
MSKPRILIVGGGYAGSLGNIGYGYDGACTCYYTDNADVDFNPGDTTQLRLSYGSGPFAMAIALEDASSRLGAETFGAKDQGVRVRFDLDPNYDLVFVDKVQVQHVRPPRS